MYAVIEAGGKQYRVTPGTALELESITGDIGSSVELGRVLTVVDGDSVKLGKDVGSAKVTGTILAHGRGEKTIVFKFKRKKQYKKTIGHRQSFTRVQINEIS